MLKPESSELQKVKKTYWHLPFHYRKELQMFSKEK